jgi:hypothetical protein
VGESAALKTIQYPWQAALYVTDEQHTGNRNRWLAHLPFGGYGAGGKEKCPFSLASIWRSLTRGVRRLRRRYGHVLHRPSEDLRHVQSTTVSLN